MSDFRVDVEITVWCESVKRGCTFSARITDGANARWYAGQGDTALEAVAWALDEYVRRAVLDRDPILARRADARPGDGLVPVAPARPRRITPAPIVSGPVLAQADAAKAEAGCFERVIPTAAAPRLHHELVLQQLETTTRRARGGRR